MESEDGLTAAPDAIGKTPEKIGVCPTPPLSG